MEVLALIPARSGSKSIPQKNVVNIAGKPLLAYTCDAANKSTMISRTILSTDDPAIAEVGKKYGVEVPYLRPRKLAKDDTPMLPVIIHLLEFLKKTENYEPNIIVLLQPTSPLRTSRHIDEAVQLLIKTGADSVVSIVEVPHQFNPVSVMRMNGEKLEPYEKAQGPLRRQDKPKVYGRNGPAILVMRSDTLLKKHSLYGDDARPYLMTPKDSVDVDTPFDLKVAEFLLESGMRDEN